MFFLSKLQTNPIQGHENPNQPRAISHAVDETLKTMGAIINRQLFDIEYNIIQIINRCFVAILDDNLLPNPVKSQISHLQIPYIKAALLDTMLFIDEAHTCRLFLDEIAHLGIGITQVSLTECGHITAVVQYLVDNFKSDLKIFKHPYKKLRNIRKGTEEKALLRERKRLPAAEKQAHLLFRKSLISQVLREALREKHFPKALHTLTLKDFTKILDRRFVKSGLFSTEFHDALNLFCFIVESIQPNDSVQELHGIFQRIPRFIAKTRAMLAEIYSKSDARKLLIGLESLYLEKARSFKQKLDQLDAEPFFEANGNGYTSFDENSDHVFKRYLATAPSPAEILSKQPSYLKCGSWFDIDTGQDTQLHRLKLVSILENTAQLIFLNNSGNEILIQNASEFIEQVNCGRSRKLDAQHLFGKALAIAITNMQLSKN